MTYSPKEEFCFVSFPSISRQICIDTRPIPIDGGQLYRATQWTGDMDTAAYASSNQELYAGYNVAVNGICIYGRGNVIEFSDGDGTPYSFSYESGWLDLGEQVSQFVKWAKKMTSVLLVASDSEVNFTLRYDFNTVAKTFQQAATAAGGGAEFNVSEFGTNGVRDPSNSLLTAGVDVSEYGGAAVTLQTLSIPVSGGGQYIKVGVSVNDVAGEFAMQQINLFAKVGRIANV